MKRTMKYLIMIVLGCLLIASCIINFSGGSIVVGYCTEDGIDYTEVREVGQFNAISSHLPCTIYFSQADKQEVRVETTEELAPKVQTIVEDGTLKLKMAEGHYPKLILRIVISVPNIESITIHGSGDLRHEGTLRVSNGLSVKVLGSGDIRMGDIVCKTFEAHTSGSGSLGFASIDCADFTGSVKGSGNLRSDSVHCDGFGVSTSGSGDIDIESVAASGSASVRVTGSGHIHLIESMSVNGDMDLSTRGSGDISLESLTASGNVSARSLGSGHIRLHEVTVDGDMDLKTSGSGDITVNGSCRDVTASTSGSGNISGNLSHAGMRVSTSGSGDVNL